jgi:hypothetical protein
MLPQSRKSPGIGSQAFDPLLESALPQDNDNHTNNLDSDYDSETDSDDDQDVKDARATRLSETRGWLGYLRDFAIFIPFFVSSEEYQDPAMPLYLYPWFYSATNGTSRIAIHTWCYRRQGHLWRGAYSRTSDPAHTGHC